jgi:hypothetical protein
MVGLGKRVKVKTCTSRAGRGMRYPRYADSPRVAEPPKKKEPARGSRLFLGGCFAY